MTELDAPSHRRPAGRTAGTLAAAALAAAAMATLPLTNAVMGQQARPAGGAAGQPPARGPAAAAPAGLDALSEDAVMSELAGRGLNSLLTRMFDERKVPVGQRDSFKALAALRELGSTPNLPDARRVALMRASVDGLNALKATLNDPDQLAAHAATLVTRGVEPDVDTLDYWGDNPVTQARVKPAADLAVELVRKAADTYLVKAKALEAVIQKATDPRLKDFEEADQRGSQARFVSHMWAYYQVLGIDASGGNRVAMGERKRLAEAAVNYLKDYDNPDSAFGPNVKLRIAKLRMAAGDYAEAKKQYGMVLEKKTVVEGKPVDMVPAPTEFQLNEARYFQVVTDVLAKKPADAEKGYADLEAWQKSAGTREFQAFRDQGVGNKAQLLTLKYRILSAKADAAAAGAERDRLNAEADATLAQVGELSPSFRALVTEQLISRLPADADLAKQGPAVLQALIARANVERLKPDDAKVDEKVLARGLEAARALAARPPGGGITPAQVENARIFVALFLHRQGKFLEAAHAYLDYATDPLYQSKSDAATAVDQAFQLAVDLFRKRAAEPPVAELYDRALRVVTDKPFERPDKFYWRGDRLRKRAEDFPEAIRFFARVPKGDKREFDARYWQMVLTEQVLDAEKDPAKRAQLVRDLAAVAGQQVRPMALAAAAAAGADGPARNTARSWAAQASLAEARAAMLAQPPQPRRAIQLVDGLETAVAGVPQADVLSGQAAFVRARAFVADGQYAQAIGQLNALAADPKTAGYAGTMVSDLLTQLGKDLDAARAAGDAARVALVAEQRAQLAPLLKARAEKEPDPAKKAQQLKAIALYEANVKFEAGEALPPGPQKTQRLREALAAYQQLQGENQQDVRMAFNIGKCQYALGDLSAAIDTFNTLLAQGKLGAAEVQSVGVDGGVTTKENEAFWEANYRLNMARYTLAQQNPTDAQLQKLSDAARRSVLPLYSVHGDRVGGTKFKKEFAELRSLLDPISAASRPAATQPAATAR